MDRLEGSTIEMNSHLHNSNYTWWRNVTSGKFCKRDELRRRGLSVLHKGRWVGKLADTIEQSRLRRRARSVCKACKYSGSGKNYVVRWFNFSIFLRLVCVGLAWYRILDGHFSNPCLKMRVAKCTHMYMLNRYLILLIISVRWLPTVLTISTPEKGWRTKNEVFASTLGLSSWHSQWRLETHLGFHFRSYEYIADCCHGNKQSQR